MKPGEGSGPIQIIPPGLLGLLQIKSPAGQNPHVLNHDVQPTIDLLPWWLRANRQIWSPITGITIAAAAVADFRAFSPNSITIPQNQWWYIHSYTLAFRSLAGGSATQLAPALRFTSVGTIKFRTLFGSNPQALENVAAADSFVTSVSQDFWCPPGSELGFYVSDVLVNDLQVNLMALDYTILPI